MLRCHKPVIFILLCHQFLIAKPMRKSSSINSKEYAGLKDNNYDEGLLPGIAKDLVNSLARFNASCSSFFHTSATLLSSGSSGLGALNRAWIDNKTVLICKAGLHLSFKISKQIRPSLSTFGW